jgi:DNA-binding CsgD family transcriptional regulator
VVIRDSPLPIALLDMPVARWVAMSERAQRLLGLDSIEAGADASILASDDPRAGGDALAMVLDGRIDGYTGNRRLRLPDGAAIDCAFSLQGLDLDGPRRFAIISFWTDRVFASHRVQVDPNDADAPPVADRVARLEQHLWRIAHEIEAAGVIPALRLVPSPSSVPGLSDISTRQWEVVTRLLRGERVSTIARELYLSPSTVRNHLAAIYRKVGVRSQAELLEHLHRARADATREL